MKFSRSNTYASAVLICALLSPVLSAQAAVPDETITITLDQAVHFIGTDGSDAVADPGDYSVEAAQEWLRLIPGTERRDALLIEAQPGTHEVKVEIPIVISTPGTEPDELDIHIVQLLNPDGTSMVATGTYSGIQSRGFLANKRKAAARAAARARARAEAARRAAAAKAQQAKNAARIAALEAKQEAEQAARKAAKAAQDKLRVLAEIKAQAGKGLGIDDAKTAAKGAQAYMSKLLKAGWTRPTKDHGLAAVRTAKVSSRGASPTSGSQSDYLPRHTYAPGVDKEWPYRADRVNQNITSDGFWNNCLNKTKFKGVCHGVGDLNHFQIKAMSRVNFMGWAESTTRMWKDFHILESKTGNPHKVNADFYVVVNRLGVLRVFLPAKAEGNYKLSVRIVDLAEWNFSSPAGVENTKGTVKYKLIAEKGVKHLWKTVYNVPVPVGESNAENNATEEVLSVKLIRGHTYRLLLELILNSRIIIPNTPGPFIPLVHVKSDFFHDRPGSAQRSVGLSYLRVKIHPDPLEP